MGHGRLKNLPDLPSLFPMADALDNVLRSKLCRIIFKWSNWNRVSVVLSQVDSDWHGEVKAERRNGMWVRVEVRVCLLTVIPATRAVCRYRSPAEAEHFIRELTERQTVYCRRINDFVPHGVHYFSDVWRSTSGFHSLPYVQLSCGGDTRPCRHRIWWAASGV